MRIEKYDLKSLESQTVNKKRLTTIFKEIDKVCDTVFDPLSKIDSNIEDYQYIDVMSAAINKIANKNDIETDSLFIAIREYNNYENDYPVKINLSYAYQKLDLDEFLDCKDYASLIDSFEESIVIHRNQTKADFP